MKYTTNRRPSPGEICTICDKSLHKRAALLFDRLYVGSDEGDRVDFEIPPEMTFGFEDGDRLILPSLEELFRKAPPKNGSIDTRLAYGLRAVSRAYGKEGCIVVPSFSSYHAFDEEFSTGREIAFEGALKNISVVDDGKLDWNQIIDFRQDKDSLRKYRDLRLWLQNGLNANSPSEAADKIGAKLDAYDWAMKKHGLATVKSAITFLLDYKQAGIAASAAAAGAALGGPAGSALASGIVIAGQMTAWVLKRFIEKEDVKRGANCEVAYIHGINRRFGDR